MKRIYLLSALLAGLCVSTTATAQIDMEAGVLIDSGVCLKPGNTFTRTESPSGDSTFGVVGAINNGPDPVLTGDMFWFACPSLSTVSEDGLLFRGFPLTEDINAGEAIVVLSGYKVDSIKTLYNYETADTATSYSSLFIARENFVDGAEYGFYFLIAGIGEDPNSVDTSLDPDNNNDFTIVRIKWNDCATSIEEMIVGQEKISIATYPNPASDHISFDYTFDKATITATARITDITGRTMLMKEFGRNSPGKETFMLDVSSLNPGMYIMEFSTDDKRAISKLLVK